MTCSDHFIPFISPFIPGTMNQYFRYVVAGKTDAEVKAIMKTAMDADPDADDFNAAKTTQMMAAVAGMVAGGTKGELKFKPENTVECRVCLTSALKTITAADVKQVVTATPAAATLVDVAQSTMTETPKKNSVTQRTCGTAVYAPLPGKTVAEVTVEFAKLEKQARRALRVLIGRELGDDEGTVSSGESNSIVLGDDNSVSSSAAADSTPPASSPSAAEEETMLGNAATIKAPRLGRVVGVCAAAVVALML